MKQVILKSLTMVNWRGAKDVTTNFNADVTTIMGANGLGKSRHFDAFIWLLLARIPKTARTLKSNPMMQRENPCRNANVRSRAFFPLMVKN